MQVEKLPSAGRVVQSYLAERPLRAELHAVRAGEAFGRFGRQFKEAGCVIEGVLGGGTVQVFSRPDRCIEDFANTPKSPEGILRFTRRYGVLKREDVDLGMAFPSKHIALSFLIDCNQWLKCQKLFREEWERKGKATHDLAKVAAEHINPKSVFERGIQAFVVPSNEGGLQVELRPDDLLGALWLAFVGHSGRTRKCQNPTCSSPYFLASRRDQKFCAEACSRLVANRRWWAEKGTEWRKENLKTKRGK
jgi:hypothetical protein